MTTREARNLKAGDVVVWLPDLMPGTVLAAGGSRAVVEWEDGGRATASLWSEHAEWWADVALPGDVPGPDTRLSLSRRAFADRVRAAAKESA